MLALSLSLAAAFTEAVGVMSAARGWTVSLGPAPATPRLRALRLSALESLPTEAGAETAAESAGADSPAESPPTDIASDRSSPSVPAPVSWRLAARRVRDRSTGRETQQVSLEPTDPRWVVRELSVQLCVGDRLGLQRTEVCGTGLTEDGLAAERALVVVSDVIEGGAAHAHAQQAPPSAPRIAIGDTIVGVTGGGGGIDTEALGYDATVEALQHALGSGEETLTLTLKRLVKRGRARVVATSPSGVQTTFEAWGGENLRMGLIRNSLVAGNQFVPNDQTAGRYDNKPKGTGDCGGNGICCTCVVSVMQGANHLTAPRASETQLLRNVARWRQSCRAQLKLDDEEEVEVRINLNARTRATPADQ